MLDTLERHNQCLLFKQIDTRVPYLKRPLEPKAKLYTVPAGEGLWLIRILPADENDKQKYYATLHTPSRAFTALYTLNGKELTEKEITALPEGFVPAMAMEDDGPSTQYEAPGHIDRSVHILEKGLSTAKRKFAIAENMADLLGRQKKWAEAVRAISIAIEHAQDRDPANLLEKRATWRRMQGDLHGAAQDERQFGKASQAARNTEKKRLAQVLRTAPTVENLRQYLQAGFELPDEPRLLSTLLGVAEDEDLLRPLLERIETMVKAKAEFNHRLVAMRLETLCLQLGESDVTKLCRAIQSAL